MARARVTVKTDLKRIAPKVSKAVQKAHFTLDQQVLKDSNNYAPMDTGNLINSSINASKIGDGQLIWDTPYAKRLYYNPQYNFSKDKNPNAGGLWYERAKSRHLNEWIRVADKAIKDNL